MITWIKGHSFMAVVLGGFILLVVIGISSGGSSSSAPSQPATSTTTSNNNVVQTPADHFGDGTFIVGKDIEPGTYKNDGSNGCYYARLKGFGGTTDDIIANNISKAVAIVTILPSDAGFESKDCGTWTKIAGSEPKTGAKPVTQADTPPLTATANVSPASSPAPAAIVTDYSSFKPLAFSDFAGAPPAYKDAPIKVKAFTNGDFLASGDRGGTSNYIGSGDPNAKVAEEVMLKIPDDANYRKAVSALSSNDLIAVYGYGSASQNFTSNGRSSLLPVITVIRMDKIGGCDIAGCIEYSPSTIFPAGVPASTPSPAPVAAVSSNPRYFKIQGQGFCDYNPGVSVVLLGQTAIPDNSIQSWDTNGIAFTVPNSIPAGNYEVDVRGYRTGIGDCPSVVWGRITVP